MTKSPKIPDDPDLTTPVHDEIMLWLDGLLRHTKANIAGYEVAPAVERGSYLTPDWETRGVKDREAFCVLLGEKDTTFDLSTKESSITSGYPPVLIWEKAVPGRNGTIGFIDLYVQQHLVTLSLRQCIDDDTYCGTSNCTHAECWQLYKRVTTSDFAFEVKSTIPSLGECIRQLRRYEAALPWCQCPYQYGNQVHNYTADHVRPQFIVVSPDVRWVETIVNQGIGFLEFPGGKFTPAVTS